MLKKKPVMISLSVLALIVLFTLLCILFPQIFMTAEERVLDKLMGDYVMDDITFIKDPYLELSAPPIENRMHKMRYHFDKDKYIGLTSSDYYPNTYGQTIYIRPVKYTCVKITDEFINNEINTQGAALLTKYKTIEDFHATAKGDAYAIFYKTPATAETYPEYNDTEVFYYINGEYLVAYPKFINAYKIKKIK